MKKNTRRKIRLFAYYFGRTGCSKHLAPTMLKNLSLLFDTEKSNSVVRPPLLFQAINLSRSSQCSSEDISCNDFALFWDRLSRDLCIIPPPHSVLMDTIEKSDRLWMPFSLTLFYSSNAIFRTIVEEERLTQISRRSRSPSIPLDFDRFQPLPQSPKEPPLQSIIHRCIRSFPDFLREELGLPQL